MENKIQIAEIVQPKVFIPVDDWQPESEDDKVFQHGKNCLSCPSISNFFAGSTPEDDICTFILSAKRCYNSATKLKDNGQVSIGFRDHCTQYLNYFEKFYDTNRYLVAAYAQIKFAIDYISQYNEENFVNDLCRYIIDHKCQPVFHLQVKQFVTDNYNIHLNYNNSKNPCLEYTDEHAELLMEISFIQNCIIPLIMHWCWDRRYSNTQIKYILMRCFDLILIDIKNNYNVDIAAKLYETITTNVSKNVSNNKVLWDMQNIRSRDPITHSMATEENIICQIIPKYTFSKNIICFNYDAIMREMKYKVIEAPYEFDLTKVSSSIRDEDNNSEADKFESHIAKIDESMVLQSNVNLKHTMEKIRIIYGPFDDAEIAFYMDQLTRDGKPIKNPFQFNLVSYLFLKDFKDIKAVKLLNYYDYVTLMIAAKRYLLSEGQRLLPFIIGGKIDRLISRKTVNKKILQRMEISELFPKVIEKYNNNKIQEEIIFKIISQILSSSFTNIDYYDMSLNGIPIKTQSSPELIVEEVLQFILLI